MEHAEADHAKADPVRMAHVLQPNGFVNVTVFACPLDQVGVKSGNWHG
jgi:hypothetical protein